MIFALILYYFISAIVWGSVVGRVLPVNGAWSRAFGFLVGFYLSAFAIGIPVVVWKYDRLSVAIAMVVVMLVGLLLSLRGRVLPTAAIPQFLQKATGLLRRFRTLRVLTLLAMTVRDKLVILFVILSALFVFFIFHARTGVYILSPWDALSSFTLMLFFVITFLVVKMIFSNKSIGLVLAVIILFSYMTHMYLPVVYETGFGGDKWRHLGAEVWVQEGNIYTPSIWGQEP